MEGAMSDEPVEDAERALAARIEAAARLLEEVADDLPQLAAIDDELRARLMRAAGRVSRPDRYTRKALSKALLRERKRATRRADQALLDQTGIRTLRRDPIFRTPLPRPVGMALDAPIRDDAGDPDDVWAEAEARRD